jgi:hypothetical protein
MNTRTPILAICLLLLFSTAAFADAISGTGVAAWQAFPATITTNNNPYWSGQSMDGTNLNVGHWLTNTGGFSSSTAGPGAMQWWGNSNGSADPNYYFQNTASSDVATLHLEVAGYHNINIFGWYLISAPTTLHVLFPGPTSPGGSPVSFTPTGAYGFYLQVGVGGPVYYTQSSLNPAGDRTHQHFVMFSPNPGSLNPQFWIGVEDLQNAGIEGSGDYNDMVVSTRAVVPEPGSLILFGTGLIGLASAIRRRLQ